MGGVGTCSNSQSSAKETQWVLISECHSLQHFREISYICFGFLCVHHSIHTHHHRAQTLDQPAQGVGDRLARKLSGANHHPNALGMAGAAGKMLSQVCHENPAVGHSSPSLHHRLASSFLGPLAAAAAWPCVLHCINQRQGNGAAVVLEEIAGPFSDVLAQNLFHPCVAPQLWQQQ